LAKQKISFKRNKNIEPPKKKTSIYEEVNGDDDEYLEDLDDLNESFPDEDYPKDEEE
jgi:hypothetical protein